MNNADFSIAKSPESLITPIAPAPFGVDSAIMVPSLNIIKFIKYF
tara:strand:+ start:307 stop:441 length:135 start_codon:yes stop_codon:yes gene_type:complete